MPFFTSSSSGSPGWRWLAALLAGAAGMLAMAEWATRRVVIPASQVLSRYENEARGAQTRDLTGKRLLICGNSTLAENVDFGALRQALAPEWEAQRWSMDDTGFYDWKYALRRLTSRGHKPAAVVIVLAPFQVQLKKVRGTFFAQYLMAPEDLLSVALDMSMHPTEAAGLAVATQSRFYAVQQDVRKTLAGRLMPFLPQLTARLLPTRPPGALTPQEERQLYVERLRELAEASRMAEMRIILAMPATREATQSESLVMEVGEEVGLPVLLAAPSGSLGEQFYRDGLHMTATGAREYTPLFAAALRRELSRFSGGR